MKHILVSVKAENVEGYYKRSLHFKNLPKFTLKTVPQKGFDVGSTGNPDNIQSTRKIAPRF
jgi:hypothetical protein